MSLFRPALPFCYVPAWQHPTYAENMRRQEEAICQKDELKLKLKEKIKKMKQKR